MRWTADYSSRAAHKYDRVDGPINLTSSAGSGALADNGCGTWSYTPALNDDTLVIFICTVTDGSLTDPDIATSDTTPVDDVSMSNDDSTVVDEGQNVVTNVLVNNVHVESALDFSSITITSAPTNGMLVDNGEGTLIHGRDGSKTIVDSFSYTPMMPPMPSLISPLFP